MFKKPESDPGLESVIADVEAELKTMPKDTKEYKEVLARYQSLRALKLESQPKRLSPDTIVNASVSLLGIIVIVGYEQKHVITSKALGFVKKLS